MSLRPLPPLTALRAFEATARHCSAKLAALELSVTPTAISHQLRALEAHLGTPLFVRTVRQLRLTAVGKQLLDDLQPAFEAMARAVDRARSAAPSQVVTLSTTPAVASRWLLPRMQALRALDGDLDLRLHISHKPVPLGGKGADMAIRYGSGQWPGLVAHALFDNHFVPVCSPRLGLHRVDQLLSATLLHFVPDLDVEIAKGWADWQRVAQLPALDAARGPVFTDETHAIAAALAGQGVALVSQHLVQAELAAGALVQVGDVALLGEPFHLVYPQARADDGAIATVRRWLLGGLAVGDEA